MRRHGPDSPDLVGRDGDPESALEFVNKGLVFVGTDSSPCSTDEDRTVGSTTGHLLGGVDRDARVAGLVGVRRHPDVSGIM